eukprot:371469_1
MGLPVASSDASAASMPTIAARPFMTSLMPLRRENGAASVGAATTGSSTTGVSTTGSSGAGVVVSSTARSTRRTGSAARARAARVALAFLRLGRRGRVVAIMV